MSEVSERLATNPLPDVPTVVISAGVFSDQIAEGMQRMVDEGHRALADLYTDSRHEIVEDAGHLLTIDRPDRVIAAVHEVVEKARIIKRLTAT